MPFATFSFFRSYLNDQSLALTGKEASSNKYPKHHRNPDAVDETWWRSTGRLDGQGEKSLNRNRAYLRAYVEAAGTTFSATGIQFQDGSLVWPDRSVIERSLRDGHLRFETQGALLALT